MIFYQVECYYYVGAPGDQVRVDATVVVSFQETSENHVVRARQLVEQEFGAGVEVCYTKFTRCEFYPEGTARVVHRTYQSA